jgi:hypothetical protein
MMLLLILGKINGMQDNQVLTIIDAKEVTLNWLRPCLEAVQGDSQGAQAIGAYTSTRTSLIEVAEKLKVFLESRRSKR